MHKTKLKIGIKNQKKKKNPKQKKQTGVYFRAANDEKMRKCENFSKQLATWQPGSLALDY